MLIYITMTELSQRLSQETEQDATNLEMRKHHITAWRYRVYLFVILVIIVMIEPMFTSSIESVRGTWAFSISFTDPMSMHTKRWEWGKLNELDALQQQIDEVDKEIASTKLQIQIVENLETPEKQNTILNCVNRDQCEGIEVGLLDRIDLLRSFLMVDRLTTNKLAFDQKAVLRNINEFLSTQVGRGQLVTIDNITFGMPTEIKPEYKLMQVPVNINISYFANNDFMTFLHNIETKVNAEIPVMWRIDAVNYDVVNYLDAQTIAMSMSLYYINVPKADLLVQDWADTWTWIQIEDGEAHAVADPITE